MANNVWVTRGDFVTSFNLGDAITWAMEHAKRLSGAHKYASSGSLVRDFTSGPPQRSKKVGLSIDVSFPGVPKAADYNDGPVGAQPIVDNTRTIKIEHYAVVRHDIVGDEFTMKLPDFARNVMAPATEGLLNAIETYVMSKAKLIPYTAPDLAITDLTSLSVVRPHLTNLNRKGAPRGTNQMPRVILLEPGQYDWAATSDSFAHADKRGSATTFGTGTLLPFSNLDPRAVQAVGLGEPNDIATLDNDNRHKAGTYYDGSVTVAGAVAEGATTMALAGGVATTGTIKPGDLFIVDGADGTYVFTGDANGNVVTADGGGAIAAVNFSPAAPEGGFPNGAAVTIAGDHIKNVVAAPGCMCSATIPIAIPNGQPGAILNDPRGFSFTMLYHPIDPSTGTASFTFSCLLAAALLREEFGSVFMSPYV